MGQMDLYANDLDLFFLLVKFNLRCLLFILCARCRPYIIDLDSQNGTFLNNQKIDPRRFYELKEKVSMFLQDSLGL